MNDYKDTAFNASQMLLQVASFLRANKALQGGLGLSDAEVREMSQALMNDVRELYKSEN